MKNARAMAEAGAAVILPERDLDADSLATAILRILGAAVVPALSFMLENDT